MSTPIASGRARAIASSSSAICARGHGHCPRACSAVSSIATTIAPAYLRSRGISRW